VEQIFNIQERHKEILTTAVKAIPVRDAGGFFAPISVSTLLSLKHDGRETRAGKNKIGEDGGGVKGQWFGY
jgi:hypothetical protein